MPSGLRAGGLRLSAMKIPTLLALVFALAVSTLPAAPARHVVVVVWDGMRPDFISPETTPNLSRLAGEGVFFAHHHPVYLSSTEVNGTAIATGAYPSDSGVIANVDYRPAIDPHSPVGMEVPKVIRRGDEVSGGHYLARPTLAELLHTHGIATIVAGSKQVALLHDRSLRADTPGVSPVLFQGETLPADLAAKLDAEFGAFPPISPRDDKIARDAWTTRVLTGGLWKDGVPAFTLLWLAEPDFSQHATGPGSAQSLEAIRSSDTNLGRVLAELHRRGLRAQTDVLVVSDHGFSTIGRKVDVVAEMNQAGFRAARKVPGGLQPGQAIVVSEGGSSLVYVGGHDTAVIDRLIAWLQTRDWAGVIFSRRRVEGTFPLAEAHIDSPAAPDLIVSLRWTADKSATGAPGLQVSDLAPNKKKVGNHASLSRYDQHNTLVAAGPDFRRGVTDTLPSANTDIAPTVAWLLGLHDEAGRMDGRVLSEALMVDGPPLKSYHLERFDAHRDLPAGRWTQYLQVSEVNGVRYLDEGNGVNLPPEGEHR